MLKPLSPLPQDSSRQAPRNPRSLELINQATACWRQSNGVLLVPCSRLPTDCTAVLRTCICRKGSDRAWETDAGMRGLLRSTRHLYSWTTHENVEVPNPVKRSAPTRTSRSISASASDRRPDVTMHDY